MIKVTPLALASKLKANNPIQIELRKAQDKITLSPIIASPLQTGTVLETREEDQKSQNGSSNNEILETIAEMNHSFHSEPSFSRPGEIFGRF